MSLNVLKSLQKEATPIFFYQDRVPLFSPAFLLSFNQEYSNFQASCNSFQVDGRAEYVEILFFPTLSSHWDTLGTFPPTAGQDDGRDGMRQQLVEDELRSECKVSLQEASHSFPVGSPPPGHARTASPRAGFIDAPDKSPPRTSAVLHPPNIPPPPRSRCS